MYEGFLEFGDVEIINSARTVGYLETSGCSTSWLQCPPCDGIADALEEQVPYVYENITEAPWYDAQDEATTRFFGVHGLTFEGLPGSTRTAETQESVLDGGVVGRVRNATRRVRVEAMLSARGEDALEAGLAWLDAALRPARCGELHTHGSGCGPHADVRIFTACPPTTAEITGPTVVWNDPVVNRWTNPQAVSTGSDPWGSVTVGAASYITDFPGTITTARRHTADALTAGARLLALQLGLQTPQLSASVRVRFRVNASHEYTAATVTARPDVTSAANETVLTSTIIGGVIPAGVSIIEAWGPSFAVAAVAASGVVLSGTPTNAASTLDVTEVIADANSAPNGLYFDGNTPDVADPPAEYGWTGTEHASTSVYRTGTRYVVEDPVAYAAAVEKITRNMHTVTCVAGPTVVQKMHRKEMWGYLVEFVLVSAVPWLHGVTKPVVINPSFPVVIQDIPFNLVSYPSAERALGTVVAATNYAPNPSLEVNANGWVTWFNGNIPGAMQGANRTADIHTDGSWSYESRVFGNDGATPITNLSSDITVTQTPITLGGGAGARYSFSVWASASILAGAAGSSIANMTGYVHWLNAADAVITAPQMVPGTVTGAGINGTVFTMESAVPPPLAVKARVAIVYGFTFSSSANAANDSDIRFYADALTISNP